MAQLLTITHIPVSWRTTELVDLRGRNCSEALQKIISLLAEKKVGKEMLVLSWSHVLFRAETFT